MAGKRVQIFLSGAFHLPSRENQAMHLRPVHYNSSSEEGEKVLTSEWYNTAFLKLKKWNHSLKELDWIDDRLVNIDDQSRVFDDKLERKMHTFNTIARIFIGLPSIQQSMKQNVIATSPQYSAFDFFNKQHEREPFTVTSLKKVADILNISAQQRKVIRRTICPQATQHDIWIGALMAILNGVKSEIEVLIHQKPSKEIRLAQQIVVSCLKFLDSAMSHDPETSSWMRLTPTKEANSVDSPTWKDVLDMSSDLLDCLRDERGLGLHVSKLEVMKEGLYQIRDVLIDKKMGYKETRFQEHLVQKKLSKTLGHPSPCLFTLLLHYLYGSVRDVEVDVRGGVHTVGSGNNICLYMGKILTVDEEKVVRNGVRQLERALGLFKFVWETAGMKGELGLQGHLWCVGAQNRSFQYKGITYFLHDINYHS